MRGFSVSVFRPSSLGLFVRVPSFVRKKRKRKEKGRKREDCLQASTFTGGDEVFFDLIHTYFPALYDVKFLLRGALRRI